VDIAFAPVRYRICRSPGLFCIPGIAGLDVRLDGHRFVLLFQSRLRRLRRSFIHEQNEAETAKDLFSRPASLLAPGNFTIRYRIRRFQSEVRGQSASLHRAADTDALVVVIR
jgi:hypothetical protein